MRSPTWVVVIGLAAPSAAGAVRAQSPPGASALPLPGATSFLGCPTNQSVAVDVGPDTALDVFVEQGRDPGEMGHATAVGDDPGIDWREDRTCAAPGISARPGGSAPARSGLGASVARDASGWTR